MALTERDGDRGARKPRWRERVRALKREIHVLYLASRHPGTPWYTKGLMFLVVAYAVSPVDLIPDFVPVLGYVDDMILLPLGIMLACRLIPATVLAQCREEADKRVTDPAFVRTGAALVVGAWVVTMLVLVRIAAGLLGHGG